MRIRLTHCIGMALILWLPTAPVRAQPAGDGKRVAVFISDTHFGLGKTVKGKWHPYEDARWPVAFQGFLVSLDEYPTDVDLVVLGDLMELWQPAPEMPCTALPPTMGCTKAQVRKLVEYILDQHVAELASVAQFAAKRNNRVYIVPGNHDAALLIPEIWKDFHDKLGSAVADRIKLVPTGVWVSADRTIIGEHGHQIGEDVNGYKKWPEGITTVDGGVTHMTRTWGENFVQSLFNKQEASNEFIDNVSPESAGLKYKLKTDGPAIVADDLVKFLRFNLFETSIAQTNQSLSASGRYLWVDATARAAGHALFIAALPSDDPLLIEIAEGSDVAAQLDQDLADPNIISADEIQSLCMHAMDKGNATVCGNGTLSAGVQGLIYTKEQVLARHLESRRKDFPSASTFVYGHTHQVDEPREVKAKDGQAVWVSNTGAFQRVANEKQFKAILATSRKTDPPSAITLESFPACYSFVAVENGISSLGWWVQDEKQVQGRRVSARNAACWQQ